MTGKWIFKHKFHFDGSLATTRLDGLFEASTSHTNVDYDETFSLVVKLATIRVVLSMHHHKSGPIFGLM
jgi:hypothetical protein